MEKGKSSGPKKLGVGALVIIALVIFGSSPETQQNVAPPTPSSESNVSEIKLTPTQDTVEAEATPNTTEQVAPVRNADPVRESAPAPQPKTSCDPNYNPCVPNVSYDLDCGDIGFSVTVIGDDVHGFDGNDNDGLGCESY